MLSGLRVFRYVLSGVWVEGFLVGGICELVVKAGGGGLNAFLGFWDLEGERRAWAGVRISNEVIVGRPFP